MKHSATIRGSGYKEILKYNNQLEYNSLLKQIDQYDLSAFGRKTIL